MAYFFQTRLKQKMVAARYTNYPLICIPSQNIFLIPATLNTQGGYLLSAGMAYFFQTRQPDPPRPSPIGFCGQSTTFAKEVFL